MPASLRVLRWNDRRDWLASRSSVRSHTQRSPARSRSTMPSRVSSASAWNQRAIRSGAFTGAMTGDISRFFDMSSGRATRAEQAGDDVAERREIRLPTHFDDCGPLEDGGVREQLARCGSRAVEIEDAKILADERQPTERLGSIERSHAEALAVEPPREQDEGDEAPAELDGPLAVDRV